jgi:phosphonate transport system ATP-binding protein
MPVSSAQQSRAGLELLRPLTLEGDGVAARVPAPNTAPPPALILEGVSAGYGRQPPILRDLDLTLPQGESWAILGPSGGGKTTLLRLVLGAIEPRSGRVLRPCVPEEKRAGRGAIGYIPQNLGLLRNLTVLENTLLGALSRLSWWRSPLGRFPAEEVARAEEALAAVGLADRCGARVDTLSGGQRRRVAIARALVQQPRLLLADEFLAELDRVTAREIIALLHKIRAETGMTVLFVDHDVETACRIADRVAVLVAGRKVCELEPGEETAALVCDLYRAPQLVQQ